MLDSTEVKPTDGHPRAKQALKKGFNVVNATEKFKTNLKLNRLQVRGVSSTEETPKKVSSLGAHLNENIMDLDLKLEDQLTNEKLRKLEHIFEEADEDGGGGLDMEEFRHAMRDAMGQSLCDHELDLLFMKVDTNCDGTVDWDEYLSYMLLEYKEKDTMNFSNQSKPLVEDVQQVTCDAQKYHDTIVQIVKLPNMNKVPNSNLTLPQEDGAGRYVSISKNGILTFWTSELAHLRHYNLKEFALKSVFDIWVTDMVCMESFNMIAVGTTSRTITFYDMNANKFVYRMQITELDVCATAMNAWFDIADPAHALLLWGDVRGSVYALEFHSCAQVCILHPSTNPKTKKKRRYIALGDILSERERFCGLRAYKLPNIHENFIHHIRYFSTLGCFMSCCKCPQTSLFMGDIEQKKKAYFSVSRGVFHFDYCQRHNIIVTCGYDSLVRVWNPYVPSKPVMLLQGHTSPLHYAIINSKAEQIVSISETNEIMVFDLNTQVCVQSITRRLVHCLGSCPLTAVCFDRVRQSLLIANNQLALFEHSGIQVANQKLVSHNKPVTAALYNKLFNYVVSGGEDSLVCVWDAGSGERLMQFCTHKDRVNGEDVFYEINAMTFDPTLRRLLTGARDGTVKIWNFNNGACLRVLESFDNCEITGIVCPKHRIITAGWNKRLTMYLDNYEDATGKRWRQRHHDDILCLAYQPPSTIASCSYDGDIVIWNLETCRAVCRLNAHKDTKVHPASIYGVLEKRQTYRSNTAAKQTNSDTSTAESQLSTSSFEDNSVIDVTKGTPSGNDQVCSQEREKQILQNTSHVTVEPETKDEKNSSKTSAIHTDQVSSEDRSDSTLNSTKERTALNKLDIFREKSRKFIERCIFLESRKSNKDTATVLACGADGWVRAWSIHHEGGLLGQFHVAKSPTDSVLAMTTDKDNVYLITGDTSGYIKIWDISRYCIKPVQSRKKINHGKIFQYYKSNQKARKKYLPASEKNASTPPAESAPWNTAGSPTLLNSFHGHLQPISYIDFINDKQYIVTSSWDCSIRLWTMSGQFKGIFGQDTPWKNELDCDNICESPLRCSKAVKLPADVRKVASSTTLTVMKGGSRQGWRLVKNIVLVWIPRLHHKQMPVLPTVASVPSQDITDVRSSTSMAVNDAKNTKYTSKILGKSYKPPRKHHDLPVLPKIRQFQTQCAAYSSLPYAEIEPIPEIKPPAVIEEIQDRNRRMIAPSGNLRAILRKKIRGTALVVRLMDSAPKPNLRMRKLQPIS